MGVRFPSQASTVFVGPLPASAAETVVCVSPPLNISLDFSQIIVMWMFSFLTGTGTNSVTMAVRRGTTAAGFYIGAGGAIWTLTIGAAASFMMSGVYPDTPGAVAGQQYALTVQQVGATAAGTFRDVALIAFAL